MPKTFFQDEKVIDEITFYSDKAKTIPVDPATREFHLKKPDGTAATVVPVTNGSTGKWKVEYVVDQYGTWEWHWKTDNPRIISQGEIWVIQRNTDS